ncbi:hypothetical protein GOEFS_098_00270 [Gordonia effusa NBRC 100432]|uniref:Uncharacterized protein n=1 Tax=Gordonia effusa NBRC 100432 TaxID=1077974 RepID=H0R4G0_9ACTN|nr:hypothetical protein GOEFS_098_00270 [Gordonia effusa NBRC 100432]
MRCGTIRLGRLTILRLLTVLGLLTILRLLTILGLLTILRLLATLWLLTLRIVVIAWGAIRARHRRVLSN